MKRRKRRVNKWGEGYIPGENWVICDHCGLRYRASEMREQPWGIWKGLMVCPNDFDDYNPQLEDIRGVEDQIVPAVLNPEPAATTIGTNTEAAPSAYDGSQKITASDL